MAAPSSSTCHGRLSPNLAAIPTALTQNPTSNAHRPQQLSPIGSTLFPNTPAPLSLCPLGRRRQPLPQEQRHDEDSTTAVLDSWLASLMAETRAPQSWSDIPLDLAGLVLRRLPAHVDRIRFAAVCPQWRVAAREVTLPPPLPLLALPDGTVYSLPRSEPFRLPACEGYTDASGGWLVFSSEDGCFLKDPLSNATVTLPALSHARVGSAWVKSKHADLTLNIVKYCSPHLIAAFISFKGWKQGGPPWAVITNFPLAQFKPTRTDTSVNLQFSTLLGSPLLSPQSPIPPRCRSPPLLPVQQQADDSSAAFARLRYTFQAQLNRWLRRHHCRGRTSRLSWLAWSSAVCLLTSTASVRFAAVCPHWRVAAREVPLPPPLPLLALPDGTVYSLPGSEPFRFPACAGYKNACGDNWLLFSGEDGCFLRDPFSNATVTLPALSRVRIQYVGGELGTARAVIENPKNPTVRQHASLLKVALGLQCASQGPSPGGIMVPPEPAKCKETSAESNMEERLMSREK
ncbi:hypothetical protein EJB05_26884, partial [Eragrostis curvula]